MASAARTRLAGAVRTAAPLWVFAALPSAGLVNGALYAPLLFGLGGVLAVAGWAAGSARPRLDLPLLVLTAAFVALSWASLLWSVAPAETARRALQLSAIAAACLLLLAVPPPAPDRAERLFPVLLAALAVGALAMLADRVAGYPMQHRLAAKATYAVTKYNRGLDYLALLVWPMLACGIAARRHRRELALACILALLLSAVGKSTTAPVALLVGGAALGLALLAPRKVGGLAAGAVTLMAITAPVWLRVAAQHRGALVGHIKASGIHRLEIWDYMTARVAERPLLGWGLAAANAVPIRPEELAHYRFVVPQGVYPHQQWLELWLELGVAGVLVALAATLLVLGRIANLPPATRAFGFATFAAAIAVSLSSFEITTDSWWAALAGSAFLLRAAARLEAA
jgi:O-antigen ligase